MHNADHYNPHRIARALADCFISAATNKKYGFICSAAILTHHNHTVKPLTAHEKTSS